MNRFAALLDRLVLTPQRNVKLRLMTDYYRATPDPDRGYALAALTGELTIASVKPAMLRALITERLDPILFGYSYDYVGDLAETIALAWPEHERGIAAGSGPLPNPPPHAGEGVARSAAGGGVEADDESAIESRPPHPALRADLSPSKSDISDFDNSIATELVNTRVRLGRAESRNPSSNSAPGSTRGPLATAGDDGYGQWVAAQGRDREKDNSAEAPTLAEIVETLHLASRLDGPRLMERWLDQLDATGRWGLIKLVTGGLRVGVSARLAKVALAEFGGKDVTEIEDIWHGVEPPYRTLFAWLEDNGPRPRSNAPAPFRPVMLAHAIADRELEAITPVAYAAEWKWDGIRIQAVVEQGTRRLYSRTGEDISGAFPDIVEGLAFEGAIDGEVLIGFAGGPVGTFGDLQQRLNRKAVTAKLLSSHPAFIRAYDCLVMGSEDIRHLSFRERRQRLETLIAGVDPGRIDLSPLVPFRDGEELAAHRAAPPEAIIEGLMLKRWDSVYEAGRPKGPWFKWKRDPHIVDAVLMYAQRGHGKRSSFYSDYTFGVWRDGAAGDELVPVGKAYFGFTDDELVEIDRFVRNNTVARFGPVREVVHDAASGLVFEVAFEGLNRSTRHKSGIAMRFPRISRLRWDKPPSEADRLETLEALLRG